MLVVLWAIMIMAVAVVGFVEYAKRTVERDAAETKEFEARFLAESGLVLAGHPGVKRGDPVLRQEVGTVRGFEVSVTTEGARIAIHLIAVSPVIQEAVRDLFFRWGLDLENASMVVDSLADWVDADDDERVRGAERDFYTRRGWQRYPANVGFRDLEEVRLVRGMELVTELNPDWKEAFTLYGDGTVDVNEASAEMIEMICQVDLEAAERLVQRRRGPDEIDHTWDDVPYTDMGEVREMLGLGLRDFARIQPRMTLAHPVRRVESRGWAGDRSKRLVAILGGGHRELFER